MFFFFNEQIKQLKQLETLLAVIGYLQVFLLFHFFFHSEAFRIPQIRRDIQNLAGSPVCTQLWPLWVNLIICVCRPVRVLSLRGTVSPQPPPCFYMIPESWPLSSPWKRGINQFSTKWLSPLKILREWKEEKKQSRGWGEPDSSLILAYSPKTFFCIYREKTPKMHRAAQFQCNILKDLHSAQSQWPPGLRFIMFSKFCR